VSNFEKVRNQKAFRDISRRISHWFSTRALSQRLRRRLFMARDIASRFSIDCSDGPVPKTAFIRSRRERRRLKLAIEITLFKFINFASQ